MRVMNSSKYPLVLKCNSLVSFNDDDANNELTTTGAPNHSCIKSTNANTLLIKNDLLCGMSNSYGNINLSNNNNNNSSSSCNNNSNGISGETNRELVTVSFQDLKQSKFFQFY